MFLLGAATRPPFSFVADASAGLMSVLVKSSPLKAAPNGFEPTSPEARAAIEAIVLDSYAWFKGLVKDRPRIGTIVQPRSQWQAFDEQLIAWLTDADASGAIAADLASVRRSIEPTAAAMAAELATARDLAVLEEALATIEPKTLVILFGMMVLGSALDEGARDEDEQVFFEEPRHDSADHERDERPDEA